MGPRGVMHPQGPGLRQVRQIVKMANFFWRDEIIFEIFSDATAAATAGHDEASTATNGATANGTATKQRSHAERTVGLNINYCQGLQPYTQSKFFPKKAKLFTFS